ncbi:MAG: hypothetical protein WAL26_13255 [Mycobacterium sp.]
MVVVIVMLGAAIVIDSLPTGCWQESISAYYYTAARNVFVAALCCLGIMLIVYKGSKDTEDVLLNLAGSLAFFVAFVPVKIPDPGHCGQVSPTAGERLAAIDNNIGAVIVGLVVAGAIIAFVYFVDKPSRSDTTKWGNWLRLGSLIILAGFMGVFLLAPNHFQATAHYVAAIMVFAIIVAVVYINAYLVSKQDEQDSKTQRRYRRRYRFIGLMMLGSVIAAIVLAAAGGIADIQGQKWNMPLFALETALLVEFAVFWGYQTIELWNHTDRNSLITPETQDTLAPL